MPSPGPPKPPQQGGQTPQRGAVEQDANMWMRAIQTTPTDLLARRFALEHSPPAPQSGGQP